MTYAPLVMFQTAASADTARAFGDACGEATANSFTARFSTNAALPTSHYCSSGNQPAAFAGLFPVTPATSTPEAFVAGALAAYGVVISEADASIILEGSTVFVGEDWQSAANYLGVYQVVEEL